MRFLPRGPCLVLTWAALLTLGSSALQAQPLPKEELLAAFKRGKALQKQGKLAEAVTEFEKAVALAPQVFGNEPSTAGLCNILAEAYRANGQYAKAEPLYLRSIQIYETKLGKEDQNVATPLNNLGLLYQTASQYAKAEPLFLRALQIQEDKLGKDHPQVATALNNLAELYRIKGQYSKAEPLYQRALQIQEAKLGKEEPLVANTLNNLAGLYQATGQYPQAEPLLQRALLIYEAKLSKDHPQVALCLNSLALLYQALGQLSKAETYFERALMIREAKLGKDHPDTAQSLYGLAVLCRALGQYPKAEPLFLRALRIQEAKLGKDHVDVAATLTKLAELYRTQEQYAKAEPLLLRSLPIWEARMGQDHPRVATTLTTLGVLYYELGQYAKAEPLYLRSLEIFESKLGKDHPNVAITLGLLGEVYRAQGQYAKAEPFCQRSLQIQEARLGPDHLNVALGLSNLAILNVCLERWDEAGRQIDRARHILRRHVSRVLPALSDSEQLDFLHNKHEQGLHRALSLGLLRTQDAALVDQSAAWLVNGIALAQESLAQRALLARDANDPLLAKDSKLLQDARKQLATLTFATPRPGEEAARLRQLEQLSAREQELAGRLGQARGGAGPEGRWVELDAIRKALPADGVLIEVAHFRTFDFHAKAGVLQAPRYAAWVIPPQGKGSVQLVDLGDAARIDAAVQAFRDQLHAAPGRRGIIATRGEPESERELRKPLQALADLVLQPLLPHVGQAKRWFLSPDAQLWLVPWAALPLSDGRYAIEQYTISYLVSGRDLVAPAGKIATSRPVILAAPDFDLNPSGKPAPALRGVSPAALLPLVPALPGTLREAAAVAPKLKVYAGTEPLVLTGKLAQESAFKALKRPRVLVLSTHGFFLDETPGGKAGLANPLLRCGLLLTGCNYREQLPPGSEDGVLTALEIVGTDLRGCELVVLSACETALGQVRNGEGVAGLRQAFQLAGARSVAATLWQVPDQETALLMSSFFDHLAKGRGKADALRDAQLDLIRSHRERLGAAHPFYWAAFTLTGSH